MFHIQTHILLPTMTYTTEHAMLAPSPKSSDIWTPSDLVLFNIKVVAEDSDTFFGKRLSDIPIPHNVSLSPRIWNSETIPPRPRSQHEVYFFSYLKDTQKASIDPDYDNHTADTREFAFFLLRQLLEYDGRDGPILCRKRQLPFEMCGIEVSARADIALIEKRWDANVYQYYLLVQVYDVRTLSPRPAVP